MTISEPEELKAAVDLNLKQIEVESNLQIFNNSVQALKRQRELNHNIAKTYTQIGSIF